MHAGLAGVLRTKIEAAGPMPFAAFMSLALYHPRFGYYSDAAARIPLFAATSSVAVDRRSAAVIGVSFCRSPIRIGRGPA